MCLQCLQFSHGDVWIPLQRDCFRLANRQRPARRTAANRARSGGLSVEDCRPCDQCQNDQPGATQPHTATSAWPSFRCTSKYAAGTRYTVTTTETNNPPMIALANGAYALLPASIPNAIGIKPKRVASEVMRMGL